jgi:hypothetical protein
MFKKCLVLALIALVFNLTDGRIALAQTQDDKNAQLAKEIKAKIAKIGTGEKSKVKIELHDKTKFKGFVSAIEDNSFTVTDKDTGATTKIEYAEVKKANRQGITLGSKIAIAGLAAGAAVILIIWRTYYCNEQVC